MNLTRKRLAAAAVALGTLAIAGPASSAAAASTVVGPTFVTTEPSVFTNMNIQVGGGDNALGGQVAP